MTKLKIFFSLCKKKTFKKKKKEKGKESQISISFEKESYTFAMKKKYAWEGIKSKAFLQSGCIHQLMLNDV